MKTLRILPALLALSLLTVSARSADEAAPAAAPAPNPAPAAEAPTPPSPLQRLIAAIGTEPLCVIGVSDVPTLADRFGKTNLSQMLIDPTYEKGLATIKSLLNDNTGIELKEFCARASKFSDGPAAIAVTPSADGIAYTVYVQTKNDDTAKQLAAMWPEVKDPSKLFSVMKLKTLQAKDLPAAEALPEWAVKNWPAGDAAMVVYPRKMAKSIEKAIADGKLDAKAKPQLLTDVDNSGVDRVALGVTFEGEFFTDNLSIDIAPDANNTFAKLVSALKEKPKGWDSLLAAMPSDGDLAVLLQSDPKPLAADVPYALQALERNLRGKHWSKKTGVLPEALDPKRFDFLIEHLHGELGISAKPTLTAELHLVLVAAVKPGDVETIRTDLIKGTGDLSAEFQTLQGVAKIGNNPPLGAQFQGRGIFTAPVIGLSPGWSWLCSNSATYQELTSNFSKGRTLANAFKAETARLNAGGGNVQLWRPEDALRVQINLDKVVQLAYTAWLLSGEDGPFIAGWRVPSDMLPPPQLFAGKLGNLRVGLGRSGQTLNGYSHSFIPGMSGLSVLLVQQLANEIDEATAFARNPPPPPPERAAPVKQKKKSKKDDTDPADDANTQAAKPKGERP